MKQNETNNLYVSELLISLTPSLKMQNKPEDSFDGRSDFFTFGIHKAISASITFRNKDADITTLDDGITGKGLRRHVTIILRDEKTSTEIMSAKLFVIMGRRDAEREYIVNFPMGYDELSQYGPVSVSVIEDRSGDCLECRHIRLYDIRSLHVLPTLFHVAKEGFIYPDDESGDSSIKPHKSLAMTGFSMVNVRFCVLSTGRIAPEDYPELQVRVMRPCGEWFDSYGQVSRDSIDETLDLTATAEDGSEAKHYHVTARQLVTPHDNGVWWAELRCMGIIIGGFAFRTDGPVLEGVFAGDDIKHVRNLRPDIPARRFHQAITGEKDYGLAYEEASRFMELMGKLQDYEKPAEQAADEEVAHDPVEEESNPDDTGWNSFFAKEFPDICEDEDDDNDDDGEDDNDCDDSGNPLDKMVGLDSVKKKLDTYEKIVRFNMLRRDNSLDTTSLPLHAMFMGSPGTGKTTVAKYIGRILKKAGVLSRGHVIVKERATLCGQNYNSEAEKTLEALEEAEGGILFIDEAYQLHQPNDPRDPGKFVIETLMTALADESKRDWMLILAGYPEPMKKMLDMNPGLRSRIPQSNIYMFEDFSVVQLMEIATNYLEERDFCLSPKARKAFEALITSHYEARDASFGNARHVLNIIDTEIIPAMAVRLASIATPTVEDLSIIEASDIPAPTPRENKRRMGFGY